jgi:hypothetical protein
MLLSISCAGCVNSGRLKAKRKEGSAIGHMQTQSHLVQPFANGNLGYPEHVRHFRFA